jgi:hypothetical protein
MTNKQKSMIAAAIVAVLLIPAFIFIALPQIRKLPADYNYEVEFEGRLSQLVPGAEKIGEPFDFIDMMTNKVLIQYSNILIIQSNVTSKNPQTGEVFWEAKEQMGVDRTTREHVSGLGDTNREGYYTFPANLAKHDYELWYPGWLSKGTCVFQGEEAINGLKVYVFRVDMKGIPSSSLYPQFAPRQILSDQNAVFKVEPVSGYIVNYNLSWDFYFVDNGAPGQHIDVGGKAFNPKTFNEQLNIAQKKKLVLITFQLIIPIVLSVITITLLTIVFFKRAGKTRKKEIKK